MPVGEKVAKQYMEMHHRQYGIAKNRFFVNLWPVTYYIKNVTCLGPRFAQFFFVSISINILIRNYQLFPQKRNLDVIVRQPHPVNQLFPCSYFDVNPNWSRLPRGFQYPLISLLFYIYPVCVFFTIQLRPSLPDGRMHVH